MTAHLISYFTDLRDASIKPPRYVIDNLLPVGLTMFNGPPKSGKSTATGAIAAMVSGHLVEYLPVGYRKVRQPGPVVWFSAEADAGALKHMLTKDLHVKLNSRSGIRVCDNPWEWQLDDDDGWPRLKAVLDELEPSVCIMDPLRDYHSQDENDSRAMVKVLRPLSLWAVENDASFIMVHHASKPSEGQQRYTATNMRGSGAIFGKADAVLTMTPGKIANRVTIDAVFKRGASWTREFGLGAFDWPRPGIEVPSVTSMSVLRAMVKGAKGEALLELSGVGDDKELMDSLYVLIRNGWVLRANNGAICLTKSGARFYHEQKKRDKWQR